MPTSTPWVSTDRLVSTRHTTVSHRNLRPDVLLERARQQPGLGEHLEAVADPDDRAAGGREVAHGVHHRREPGDRAGAQVVAVGEAAGDDDGVEAGDGAIAVPHELAGAAEVLDRVHDVELAVRAGEHHDADPCTPSGLPRLQRAGSRR